MLLAGHSALGMHNPIWTISILSKPLGPCKEVMEVTRRADGGDLDQYEPERKLAASSNQQVLRGTAKATP